jgi:rhodanese-related sulfurtransferase
MIPTITPTELHAELHGPNPPTMIDVREAYELTVSSLPGAIHIPLGQLPGHLDELDKDGNLVIMCRVGGRSAQATSYLLQKGFTNVRNLESGINGWARTVDTSMSEY